MFTLPPEQRRHSKKKNGKFQKGTKAYEERKQKLALISARITAGKSFSDLQGA